MIVLDWKKTDSFQRFKQSCNYISDKEDTDEKDHMIKSKTILDGHWVILCQIS